MKIPETPEIIPPPGVGEEFVYFAVQLFNPNFDAGKEAQFVIRLDADTGAIKDIYLVKVREALTGDPTPPPDTEFLERNRLTELPKRPFSKPPIPPSRLGRPSKRGGPMSSKPKGDPNFDIYDDV